MELKKRLARHCARRLPTHDDRAYNIVRKSVATAINSARSILNVLYCTSQAHIPELANTVTGQYYSGP